MKGKLVRNPVRLERKSDRELSVAAEFEASLEKVFEAWSQAEAFQAWWVPKSAPITLLRCRMDVRTGGTYSLLFRAGDQEMEFFGRYLEVQPNERIVWTNEEAGVDQGSVTTVIFREVKDSTELIFQEAYPSKEALDEAFANDSVGALPEQFQQLDQFLKAEKRR